MRVKRTLALTKRVLKQFRHDRRTFAFILIMPLLMILIFGYTFGGEVSNVKVIVVNQDETATIVVPDVFTGNISTIELNIGDHVIDEIDTDTLKITEMDDFDKARDKVKSSQFTDRTWAVIYIPKEFTASFSSYMGKVVVSKSLKNRTACEATGYFWYEDGCHAFADSQANDHFTESNCKKAGFEWYNSKCHEDFGDRAKWTETECLSKGYFWYDGICHDGSDITLVIDASNPNIDATVHMKVVEAMTKAQRRIMAENPELKNLDIALPVAQRDDYAFGNGDIEFIDSFAPAIMAFAMMMVTTMITIFLFIEERKMGTLDRLLASPASETEIVVGYALAFSVVSLLQATVILVTAIGLFGIYIAEPVLLQVFISFIFLILLGMGHQCLGIMLSSGAKNELQAIQFIPLIIFPSILLCGLFWPMESIPLFLRPLSYIVPLTYAIDAVRGAMLRGLGLGAMCCHGSALIVFTLVMLMGAVMLLKRRK
jgi:ABC transporter DrrB family efflux protein